MSASMSIEAFRELLGRIDGYGTDREQARREAATAYRRVLAEAETVEFVQGLIRERNNRIAQLELDLAIAVARAGEVEA